VKYGPNDQKWVCAAGVEQSTLHRRGLTGLGLITLSFIHQGVSHFSGPGSRSGSHKKWSSHRRSRGKVACQAGLTIGNSSFLFSPDLLLCQRYYRFALKIWNKKKRMTVENKCIGGQGDEYEITNMVNVWTWGYNLMLWYHLMGMGFPILRHVATIVDLVTWHNDQASNHEIQTPQH
jgi:hypothetical protein